MRMFEAEQFEPHEMLIAGPGARAGNLAWKQGPGGYALTLTAPMEGMRVTDWPAHLPRPLTVIGPGQSVVIDWNGRFHASLFGSNRSYFYEQHRLAAACLDSPPAPDLFLTLKPRKLFDFTTRIY